MAKHKGKRTKSRRDSGSPEIESVSATRAAAAPAAQTGTTPARSEPVEGLRVEGNVIHLPKQPAPEESASMRTTMRAGSGWGAGGAPSSENPLRSEVEESQRSTIPPEAGESESSEVSGEVLAPAPAASEASEAVAPSVSSKEPGAEAAAAPSAPSATPAVDASPAAPPEVKAEEKKPAAKTEEKKSAAKADEKKPAAKADEKRDVIVGRGERRDRKESLSTHLSDEAKAFFSDKSLEAAYKPHHDNFEDLTPAHEDHAHEIARSRKWMRVTGMLLVGVVVVVGAFALHSRYGVQETSIPTSQFRSDPLPPPAPPPAPAAESAPAPVAEATPPAPASAPAPESVADAAPGATSDPPTAPAVAVVADAAAAVAPAAEPPAPVVAPPPPVAAAAPPAAAAAPPAVAAAPAGDAAALLSAARRSGRIDAWEAYFNAAPTEDRLMATTAMAMAERGRNADAERLAQRAVTANPENGQGWFVLAAMRSALRNRDGAREAKQRCIALGGRWASECRGI